VELGKLRILKHLDRAALATYCGAYALWVEAMEQLQKYGTMIKPPSGYPQQSPYLAVANGQEPAIPDCQPELGAVAKQEWARLADELGKLRILTNLDRAALAVYCGAYALWMEAIEQIEKYGSMVKSPSGYPQQSIMQSQTARSSS